MSSSFQSYRVCLVVSVTPFLGMLSTADSRLELRLVAVRMLCSFGAEQGSQSKHQRLLCEDPLRDASRLPCALSEYLTGLLRLWRVGGASVPSEGLQKTARDERLAQNIQCYRLLLALCPLAALLPAPVPCCCLWRCARPPSDLAATRLARLPRADSKATRHSRDRLGACTHTRTHALASDSTVVRRLDQDRSACARGCRRQRG